MATLIYGTAAHYAANQGDVLDLASPSSPGYRAYKNRAFEKLRLQVEAKTDVIRISGRMLDTSEWITLHETDGLDPNVLEFVEITPMRYITVARTEGSNGTTSKVYLDE